MFKNIFISFLVFIFSFGLSFAEEPLVDLYSEYYDKGNQDTYDQTNAEWDEEDFDEAISTENSLTTENERLDSEFDEAEREQRDNDCDINGNCIDRSSFVIKVDDISPGMKVQGDTVKESVNFVLGTIIQKLMIALGSFALLIMTIGAGYIILNNGQDEILNKGKSIFMSGVYALVIALSSYYLIAIVRFILF